ncbi:MAG: hypothetical protein ACRD1U_09550 [Vicinamibacterales bacterium]
MHRALPAASSRRDCPTAETLARAAAGVLPADEREAIADHIGGCTACADEYRHTTPLREWAASVGPTGRTGWRLPVPIAAAAAVTSMALSGAAWSWVELRTARKALDEAAARAAGYEREAVDLRAGIARLSGPQVNAPVLDLIQADATRGTEARGEPGAQRLTIPVAAAMFTLILTAPNETAGADHAIEILDASGAPVWRGGGLKKGPDNTFTIAIPRTLLTAGLYTINLKSVSDGQERLADSHLVRIEYR